MLCLINTFQTGKTTVLDNSQLLQNLGDSFYLIGIAESCQKLDIPENELNAFVEAVTAGDNDVFKISCSVDPDFCQKLQLLDCPSILYVTDKVAYPYAADTLTLHNLQAWKKSVETNGSVLQTDVEEKALKHQAKDRNISSYFMLTTPSRFLGYFESVFAPMRGQVVASVHVNESDLKLVAVRQGQREVFHWNISDAAEIAGFLRENNIPWCPRLNTRTFNIQRESGLPFVVLAAKPNETKLMEQFQAGAQMRDVEAVWGIIDIEDNEWLSQTLNGTTDPAVYVFNRRGLYGDVLASDVPCDVQAKRFLREVQAKQVEPLQAFPVDEPSTLPIWIALLAVLISVPALVAWRCGCKRRARRAQKK